MERSGLLLSYLSERIVIKFVVFNLLCVRHFFKFGYGREYTFLVTMFYHRLRIQEEHLFLVTVGGRVQTTHWIASTGNLRFSGFRLSPLTPMPLYSSNELEMV
jgi:hypothetical protein